VFVIEISTEFSTTDLRMVVSAGKIRPLALFQKQGQKLFTAETQRKTIFRILQVGWAGYFAHA